MSVAAEVRVAPDIDELTAELVGHEIVGREVTIRAHEAWLGHEAMGVEPADGDELDPMFAVVIALRGMTGGIAGIIELAHATPSETLYGGLGVEQQVPLHRDVTYRVAGRITALTRRSSRRIGVFDEVHFRLTVRHGERDDVHAAVTNSFLFRRPSA